MANAHNIQFTDMSTNERELLPRFGASFSGSSSEFACKVAERTKIVLGEDLRAAHLGRTHKFRQLSSSRRKESPVNPELISSIFQLFRLMEDRYLEAACDCQSNAAKDFRSMPGLATSEQDLRRAG